MVGQDAQDAAAGMTGDGGPARPRRNRIQPEIGPGAQQGVNLGLTLLRLQGTDAVDQPAARPHPIGRCSHQPGLDRR